MALRKPDHIIDNVAYSEVSADGPVAFEVNGVKMASYILKIMPAVDPGDDGYFADVALQSGNDIQISRLTKHKDDAALLYHVKTPAGEEGRVQIDQIIEDVTALANPLYHHAEMLAVQTRETHRPVRRPAV